MALLSAAELSAAAEPAAEPVADPAADPSALLPVPPHAVRAKVSAAVKPSASNFFRFFIFIFSSSLILYDSVAAYGRSGIVYVVMFIYAMFP